MKKWMIWILSLCLFLSYIFWLMNVDVKKGAAEYERNHPPVQTSFYDGNASILNDGKSFYSSLITDVENARHSVSIHFFIIRDDDVTRPFFSLLQRKAEEGVDIRLSVDAVGSDMKGRTIEGLKASGVKFLKSRPVKPERVFYRLHHRNHRRIIVIDDAITYIGGFNLGKEYIGKDPDLGYWRDYHLRIEGGVAKEAAIQFNRDWKEDGGKGRKTFEGKPTIHSGDSRYSLLFNTGGDLEGRMRDWIDGAEESLIIATPYFIPTDSLMISLKNAVSRGVDVRILVPDETDAWFTKPPGYKIEKELLEAGAGVYLYEKGFFHGKVMIIDHQWADLGTANWDPRSLFLNDESNCIIEGNKVTELEQLVLKDMEDGRRLSFKDFEEIPLWQKGLEYTPKWVFRYF